MGEYEVTGKFVKGNCDARTEEDADEDDMGSENDCIIIEANEDA